MTRFIALFFLVTHSYLTHGQDLVKLEQELVSGKLNTKDSIEVLNLLGRSLTFINQPKALVYANLALQRSIKSNNAKGIAYAYRNLSSLHSYNESYFVSMEYIQQALEIFEASNDSVGMANCYISLGHTYRRLRNREEEVYYHKRAFEIFSRVNDKERIGVTSHNLGESYFNAGDNEKGKRLTRLAIQINDSIKNNAVLSSCYKVMGMIEFSVNELDSAEQYLQKVLVLSEQLGENSQKVATAEAMFLLASINKLRGNRANQLKFLLNAADFCARHNLGNHLQDTYQELILYFASNNDQNAVIKYINSYKIIKDSLNQKQFEDRYSLANSVIEVHKLSRNKNELEKANFVQAQKIESRNKILLVIFFSVIVLLWLLLKFARLNKKLEAQIQINERQKHDLEILNNTKDKFFSIVAHDLKSPLASLKSFSALLIDHYDDLNKEDILTMSRQLQSAVDNTIKMADNLIIWARIQMNDIQHKQEAVSLNEIGRNIYNVYKDLAADKGIVLNYAVDDAILLLGDKNQIEFIIRNLVNNAIKFTKQGGYVTLRAQLLNEDTVEILVEDNGVGIPNEIKERLFSVGKKQSTNGTAGEKGTGLGLMLSAEFLKLNNGEITIESEIGKGSQFKIRLKRGVLAIE